MAKPTKADKVKERRERGRTYLKELLARVPEDSRESVLEVLQTDDILDHVGDSVLRQSDYSRGMDEQRRATEALAADVARYQGLYDDNVRWRASQADNVTALEAENARFKNMLAADPILGDGGGGEDPSKATLHSNGVDLSDYVKREEAEKQLKDRLAETERNGIQLMAMISTIQARHLKNFDEALDAQELFEHATKTNLPLPAAYQDFVKERVEESREKEHKEEIARAKEEGRIEALRAPVLPHIVENSEPTAIDVLGMNDKERSEFGLKKATDEYYDMQAAKRNAP